MLNKYANSPDKMVNPYAIIIMMISFFPDESLIRDMAGVTSPKMMSGMVNPKI